MCIFLPAFVWYNWFSKIISSSSHFVLKIWTRPKFCVQETVCNVFWNRSDHICIFYFVIPLLQDTACLAFLGLFKKKEEGMEGLLSSHDVEKDCGNSIANSINWLQFTHYIIFTNCTIINIYLWFSFLTGKCKWVDGERGKFICYLNWVRFWIWIK